MRDRTGRGFRQMGIAAMTVAALAACSSGPSNNAAGDGQGEAAAGAANGSGPVQVDLGPNNDTAGNGQGGVATGATNGSGPVQVGSDGVTNIPAGSLQPQLDALPVATLTAEEEAGLIWMREEEKLALDVYAALYDQWQVPIFTNIADAEQTHTDAVKALLDRYAIADPSVGTTPGTFTDPDIQALYTTLVAQGSTSLVAALTVGATIEDLDIADLQARATTTPDIALVYANLEKGSRNHLRAFVKQLTSNGATYTPTYISQTDFDAIVSSDIERGTSG